MASQISTDDVFKKAHDQFLASLPPNERTRLSSCSSADQLLIEVRKLEVVSKDRVRGRGFIRRIKALSDGLKPYFNSISTMIQSNPELTSLVLGGIQFVLQLASNYTTFFDKLTLNFERLAHQLPQHDLIVQLYKGSHRNEFTERVKASLEDVYVDTFQFLQSIARVFIRKDGKYKHRPLVMASLAWQPFDTRFDEMLERMELHRNVLKEVVQLDQIHAAIGERERTEKARQEEEKERLAAVKAREAQKVERALSEAIREQLLKASREAEDARLEAEERHKQDYEDRQLKDRERYEEVKERLLASDERENLKCTNERIADMKDDIEQERRVYSIDRIRNWLSPPEFLQEYEKAVDIREDGTTDWLFEDPRLENWALSNPARSAPSKFEQECLWVQGNPGYGKTVLAAAAVGELKCIIGNETNDISDTHPGVFHFLFRAGIPTMDSNDAAHRAILAQILQAHRQDLDAIDKFVFAMNEMSGGQMVASKNELAELLRVFSTYIGRYYIVLDGIDECRDNSALVQDLLKLKQDSQIMILLFSRPNVASLFQTIPTEQHIFVGRKTSRDIEVYLSKQVNLLQEQNLLPSTANTGKLVSHLVTGADGMFLWARLMVSFLKSPALSRAQRVEAIKRVTLPEGLESMYDRISDLIGQGYQAEQHFAKQIIIWLTFTIRRLTVQELQEATASTNMEESEPEDIQEFIQRVVMTCAGLVEPEEMYSPAHGRTSSFFRFIHLSAKEYYASQENFTISSNKKSFSITPWNCHIEITRRCLYFLTYKLPAQPLQGSLGSSVTHDALDKVFPFSSYAALYWIEHLQESNFDIVRVAKNNDFTTQDQFGDLLLALSRFLSQSFVLMSWIEASYVCGQAPSFELLQQWSNWAKNIRELHLPQDLDVNKLHEDVMELSCYLKELNEYWGSKLITTPGCIWEEVTAFTPCRLLPRIGVLTVHSLVTEELSGDYLSTKCLCKVSESTPNGLLVGVLSIWPSRDYEKFTQQKSKDVSLKTLRNLSLGWVARYEIWSLAAEPARIVDHRFSLDSKEVWLQMGHSMCNSVEPGEARGWGIQFPMAISASVRMFTVLRTLYCLKPATSKPGLILDSSILAMEVDGSIPTHWSPDHNPFVRAGDSFESSYLELDERFERGDLYLYWISFHPDDRFILFVGQDLHAPSTAAVFHIQSSKKLAAPCFNCSKLNAEGSLRRHPEWSRDFNQVKVIYHPTNPLLGFSFAGLLYLWPFKNNRHPCVALTQIPKCNSLAAGITSSSQSP
ncbi:hypothetical protein AOQ84DRAFT_137126 [Glonium stellatum]|uniref:NACHT domain-containing protein n=1 Tax=Glonium stellatum TaxID=574774 RepID=A0A8E2ET21_9PEZI|nr:hypothetical protein AOQ84DRAFT_137126 [Glonium stellatum]